MQVTTLDSNDYIEKIENFDYRSLFMSKDNKSNKVISITEVTIQSNENELVFEFNDSESDKIINIKDFKMQQASNKCGHKIEKFNNIFQDKNSDSMPKIVSINSGIKSSEEENNMYTNENINKWQNVNNEGNDDLNDVQGLLRALESYRNFQEEEKLKEKQSVERKTTGKWNSNFGEEKVSKSIEETNNKKTTSTTDIAIDNDRSTSAGSDETEK